MKRIVVSEHCAACGSCTLESDLLIELPDGKAAPAGTGLISYDQYASFIRIMENCPVKAISVVDEEITQLRGTASTGELKNLIDQKLKGYEVELPSFDDFDFVVKDYSVPLTVVTSHVSDYEYSTYDKANSEGFKEFERTAYSQRKTMVQALLISYKTKQLSKFTYYRNEGGNYYYEICRELSGILNEIEVLAKALTHGKINLPDDFAVFEAGPDYGYDGDLYCYKLRNIEQLPDWENGFESVSYYETYIDCEESDGNYRYNLYKAEEKFKEHVAFELSLKIGKSMYEWIGQAIKPFQETVRKRINDKVMIIKTALKACKVSDMDSDADPSSAIKNELMELVEKMQDVRLTQESIFKSIDTDYNSDYRFSSESEAREAARNRLLRYYDSCKDYLSTGHLPNISEDLSKKYQSQIEAIFNAFKTNVQAVFDKYEMNYPPVSIEARSDKQTITVHLASFEDCSSNMGWEIRDFIDEKIIGFSGKVKHYDYFKYDASEIDIFSTSEWKKGFFGNVEKKKYNYLLSFGSIMNGFNRACEACCEYTFNDGFLQAYLNILVENFIVEFNKEVISKIEKTR
ncbi:MAG: ferredoxin [Paenibacillus macerans]|uniref:ferredoxin n=1 Tax=Paenibacillus macerans TaxID=44252 RepID=UPI00242D98E4|nr:ferredoxin [Paenibacillus macerans]MBS5913099.1 ferredoxin [Paenibacillus macerans]